MLHFIRLERLGVTVNCSVQGDVFPEKCKLSDIISSLGRDGNVLSVQAFDDAFRDVLNQLCLLGGHETLDASNGPGNPIGEM
jgi:hypothetical protein